MAFTVEVCLCVRGGVRYSRVFNCSSIYVCVYSGITGLTEELTGRLDSHRQITNVFPWRGLP